MNLKRVLSGLLFAASILSVLGTSICVSKAFTEGDWVYSYSYTGHNHISLTGYIGNSTEVTIPYKIKDFVVYTVEIKTGADESKENLKNVKKVTFGSGFEKIDHSAIPGFENVEELVLPDTVTVITGNAFMNQKKLKSVQLPSSLKTIDDTAFANCWNLKSITVPEGVVTIGTSAFENCSGLESVSLPQSLKEIGVNVFKDCTGLKDENGMVIVNDRLYYMDIPEGTTEITIPEGIKVLDGELFAHKYKIKKVTIPEGLTRIEQRVFEECINLEEVIVPDSVNYIGSYVFYKCRSLKKLKLPSDFAHGLNPFRACEGLKDENGFVIVNRMFCDYFGDKDKVVVPEGVKEIEQASFFKKNITEIELPDSLTRIAESAFSNSDLKKIEIPDSVTEIGRAAFERCSSLSEVKLSKNLKVLSSALFKETPNLKKMIVPEGVVDIDDSFSGSGIEELTVPSTLEKFRVTGVQDGTKVIYNGTPEEWEKILTYREVTRRLVIIFLKLTPVPTVTNTATPTPVPATATPVPTVTTEPVLTPTVTAGPEATVTAAPEVTATSAPSITTVPSSTAEPTVAVTTAPTADIFKVNGNTYKIKGKTAILIKGAKKSKVVIPSAVKFKGKKYKVTAIGKSAFKSNKKLKSVTIGKNVKSIGKKAFYKASKLSRVTIKSKLLKSSKVGKYAFKGVSKKVVFKVPAAKKKAYSKIIKKSLKKYKIV